MCEDHTIVEKSMTVKLIVIYDRPADAESFFKHYTKVHAPLVKEMPGLERLVVNRIVSDAQGNAAPYVAIAEMSFRDGAALQAAMQSPAAQKVVEDFAAFTKGKATALVAESKDAERGAGALDACAGAL